MWNNYPRNLDILPGTIHLWRSDLSKASELIHYMYSKILNAEEKQRANKFIHEVDRSRCILSRATLRLLLGLYLNENPEKINISKTKYGKPIITDNWLSLKFNLSHSHNLILFAFSVDSNIGVDIEKIRYDMNVMQLANHCFSEYERKVIANANNELKTEIFFKGWTRKEAFIKAIGKGLYYPLDKFDVELCPHKKPKIHSIYGDTKLAEEWTLQDITTENDYAGAIAIKGNILEIICYDSHYIYCSHGIVSSGQQSTLSAAPAQTILPIIREF